MNSTESTTPDAFEATIAELAEQHTELAELGKYLAVEQAFDDGSSSHFTGSNRRRTKSVAESSEPANDDDDDDDEKKNGPRAPRTDVDRAMRLADRILDDNSHVYDASDQTWLYWTGTHWDEDAKGSIMNLTMRLAKKDRRTEGLASHAITSAVSLAKAVPDVSVIKPELDRHPYALNCRSGTINLYTGELQKHDPDQLLTVCAPTEYDPTMPTPVWQQFLDDVFPDDPELIAFLQRWVGMALIGEIIEEKLLIAYGQGANGKSTLFNTITDILGPGYFGGMTADSLMNGGDPYALAKLRGKRIVVAPESSAGQRLNDATLKTMTSVDTITARHPYGRPFDYTSTHSTILFTNHAPVISASDEGTWRRVILLPFEQSFLNRKDPGMKGKLMLEAPGILAWMVQGAQLFQRDGLGSCKTVDDATAAYRSESDLLGSFVAERCIAQTEDADLRVDMSELYEAWTDHCRGLGINRAWTRPTLEKNLKERGLLKLDDMQKVRKQKSNGKVYVFGLALDADESQRESSDEPRSRSRCRYRSRSRDDNRDDDGDDKWDSYDNSLDDE